MANDSIENLTTVQTLPDLTILEPYLGSDLVSQMMAADTLTVSIGIIIISFILATLIFTVLKIITKVLAGRTKTELDDKILEAIQQPIFRLIIIGGFYLAVANLGVGDGVLDLILRVILTLAYLTIIMFVLKVLSAVVNYGLMDLASKTNSDMDDEIIPIFHKAAAIVVWAFGLIMILGGWGVDVAPFIAGVGIAGLAISFALQSTLSNVVAGISIIMDKTFRVGDKIGLDSGEVGTIHEITLRSTRILTYDNELLIVPNNNMASAKIKNYSQPDLKVRVVVPFTVEYGSDPAKVIKLIEKTITNDIEGILEEPKVSVVFTQMADFSLNFQLRFWVEHYGEAYGKKLEATDVIYNTLGKNKIGIPFPTRTIYMKK
ncbi:mechanosensitive ion channel family protein [Candidatus Micrarchaeota archaeon]|nr:mechanosensitive ion channel family protein [Candidatus Micrarchaeota archaeon]